jgi:Tol biopolymer transport system component
MPSHLRLIGAVTGAVVSLAVLTAVANARPMAYDGPLVAFESYRDGKAEIYAAPVNGSSPAVNLTRTPDTNDRHPSWHRLNDGDMCGNSIPPTSQLLAFDSDRAGGDADIFSMNGLATPPAAVMNLTPDDPANDTAPAWSPTALDPQTGLIAYTVDHGGNRDVWVMNADGTSKTPITNHSADDANPDWSPSSSNLQIAFESNRNGTRQIYVVDLTASPTGGTVTPGAVHQVTFGGGPKFDPTWAIYSDRNFVSGAGPHDIAYSVQQGGKRFLDVAELGSNDGPAVTNPFAFPGDIRIYPLTGDPGGDSAPNWSPKGLDLVYASTAGGANEDIYGLGSAFRPGSLTPWQGPATRLTTDRARDTNPDWQPYEQCSVMAPRPPLPAPSRASRRGGGGGGGGGGSGARLASPRLTIRTARWHGKRVSVGGRAARGLSGRLRVAFSCGRRGSQHTQRLVRARSGRFGARLRAPRACRRARRGVVAAAYGGDHRHRAQKVTRRVRRR